MDKSIDIKSICNKLGITTHTYYARKQRGWTEDEALLMPKVGAVYKINGESVYKYLKRMGGSYNSFQYRIRTGYNFEDSINGALNVRRYKGRKKNENM